MVVVTLPLLCFRELHPVNDQQTKNLKLPVTQTLQIHVILLWVLSSAIAEKALLVFLFDGQQFPKGVLRYLDMTLPCGRACAVVAGPRDVRQ